VRGPSKRAVYSLLAVLLNTLLFAVTTPRAQAAGQLTLAPSALNFGNVVVGQSQVINITLTNSGNTALNLSSHTLSGAGFHTSGILYPMTVGAGVTIPLSVIFVPTTTGNSSGTVQFFTTGPNGTVTLTLNGTGVAAAPTPPPPTPSAGQLTLAPSALNFGNVVVGQSQVINITLTNSGNTALNLSSHTLSGAGFHTSGIIYPMTVGAGVTVPLSVIFAPTTAGNSSGTVQFFTTGPNGTVTLTLSGTGVASGGAGYASATPIIAQFANVPVGTQNMQTIELMNTGTASYTVSSITAAGSGFSVSGITTPMSIAAGANAYFTVAFLPQSAGSFSGSVAVTSTASDSQISVVLSGTAVSGSRTLAVAPSTVTFGSISVGGTETQEITLTNAGNSNLSISGVSISGAALSATGLSGNTTLAPGQTAVVTADFAPKTAGRITGTITITSNASNGTSITVPVTGTGVVATHVTALQWQASSSTGQLGYYVYRSTVSGGPYTKLVGSPINGTSYSDNTVNSGTEYYYVVTAVSSDGVESSYSNQVTVTVP
jgi:hypothetical protein